MGEELDAEWAVRKSHLNEGCVRLCSKNLNDINCHLSVAQANVLSQINVTQDSNDNQGLSHSNLVVFRGLLWADSFTQINTIACFYEETINVFSLLCRLMRRENGLYLSVMQRRLQKSNMVLLSAHNQQRKEQRQRLKWLPNELQEFSNVLMFPYDQIWIYCVFARYRNHWQILPQEQLTGYSAFSEEFIFEGN